MRNGHPDSHSSRKCRGTQLHVPPLDSSLSNVYTKFCIEHNLYFLMIIYSQLLLYSPQPNSIILYYTLIYPFLTYTLTAWGNTYPFTLKPLVTLQKKTVRIITFSSYNDLRSPLFRKLDIFKFCDLVFTQCICLRIITTLTSFFCLIICLKA